jgi:hypothetical protein
MRPTSPRSTFGQQSSTGGYPGSQQGGPSGQYGKGTLILFLKIFFDGFLLLLQGCAPHPLVLVVHMTPQGAIQEVRGEELGASMDSPLEDSTDNNNYCNQHTCKLSESFH